MKITHPQVTIAREMLYTMALGISKKPSRGKTVVMFGNNGSGKTRLIKKLSAWFAQVAIKLPLVLREDNNEMGLACQEYRHWPSVVDGFQKRKDFNAVDRLMLANVLFLDDIGAEHDPSGFAREQIYLILSRREFRWNFLTTNYAPSEWAEKFEQRIASRLFRNAEQIDLSQVPDFSTI
jgi:DNA replication protein DnaC